MKIKRISIGWDSMTGIGPAAWARDHHILTVHTPHHEQDHQKKHIDDGKKEPNHTDEKEPDKEA